MTQEIARKLHAAGFPGFRWWSALHGDWHAVLLFLDRIRPGELCYGDPEALAVDDAAVRAAAVALRMEPARR